MLVNIWYITEEKIVIKPGEEHLILQRNMTESGAKNITVEKALLSTNKQALVQAISQHLEGISKKPKVSSNHKEVLSYTMIKCIVWMEK